MPELNMTVNGKPVSVETEPNEYLAAVLRYKLGLTGTKIGCDEAECGACTVIVNGTSVDSCIFPALKAQGAEVLTIEGLADTWRGNHHEPHLHPLQSEFIQQGALQCGYCTPGILMAGVKLLEERPRAAPGEVEQALTGNLCRCTGYYKILSAFAKARRA